MSRSWTAALLVMLWANPAVAALGDNDLGVNVHNGTQAYIDAAAALGVTWVRVDANWFQLEPSSDNHQWAPLDAAVMRANTAGLNVYMTLAYTPDWVPRHGDTDQRSGNDVPNASTEWVDFVTDAVTHYRALGVTHFGLWNEANLQGFWEGTLTEYANIIVIPGAAAVRAACNDCVVLGPDLANVGDADDALEEVLMRTPGAWDIITHHIYQDFEETGWRIWDGDSYINVLDSQRFPFTRRSLRQILDAANYTGEVWITETGYRAAVGDMADEQLQAVYLRRTMEEQLQRAWVTNTFFYEIHDCGPDQPNCTIDGYGVMRATAGQPGLRTFPTNFRLKPAFGEVQTFVMNNPAIVSGTPALQCGDGVDNDNDGRIDLEDRGCSGPQDDDESDDPPRERIEAPRRTITVDGDLSDHLPNGLIFDDMYWRGTEPLGTGDLSVEITAHFDADHLYLGVEVVDDVHLNDQPANTLWLADSLQIAFDISQNGGTGYDGVDDHEITIAASTDLTTTTAYREVGPAGATDDFEVAVSRAGDRTYYEVAIDRTALPGATLSEGAIVGFTFLVNDDDGTGRAGWIEWTEGVGNGKVPESFGEIAFVMAPVPMDGGVRDGGSVVDGGTADAGTATDAGTAPRDGGSSAVRDAGTTVKDAGTAGATPPASEDSCSCAATTRSANGAWLLLILLFVRRRR